MKFTKKMFESLEEVECISMPWAMCFVTVTDIDREFEGRPRSVRESSIAGKWYSFHIEDVYECFLLKDKYVFNEDYGSDFTNTPAYQRKAWCATYEYKGRHWLPASLLTEENQHMVTDDSISVERLVCHL